MTSDLFHTVNAAWARKDFPAVRSACAGILGAPVSAPVRSYAHLRMAQSLSLIHI